MRKHLIITTCIEKQCTRPLGKNDGVRCCNKLPGNNVEFATGLNSSNVKIGPDRTHGNRLYAIGLSRICILLHWV